MGTEFGKKKTDHFSVVLPDKKKSSPKCLMIPLLDRSVLADGALSEQHDILAPRENSSPTPSQIDAFPLRRVTVLHNGSLQFWVHYSCQFSLSKC